jgi:hypothetical protein
MKFTNHITLGFDRFRWDANGDQGRFDRCTVLLPDVLVPDGAQAEHLEVYSAALLFSGGIKQMLVAIGKSAKRGQKKGLFVMQTHAYDR